MALIYCFFLSLFSFNSSLHSYVSFLLTRHNWVWEQVRFSYFHFFTVFALISSKRIVVRSVRWYTHTLEMDLKQKNIRYYVCIQFVCALRTASHNCSAKAKWKKTPDNVWFYSFRQNFKFRRLFIFHFVLFFLFLLQKNTVNAWKGKYHVTRLNAQEMPITMCLSRGSIDKIFWNLREYGFFVPGFYLKHFDGTCARDVA